VATPWHPFLTARNDGLAWVRADELTTDDFIVEAKETPGVQPFPWMNEDFCWLFGYLLGDGWLTTCGSFICCATGVKEAENARVLALLQDWFPTVSFTQTPFGYIRGNSRPVVAAMAELGMNGKATTKRVPEWVFRSTPEFRRAFLRGFAAADGHRLAIKEATYRRVEPEAYRVELANQGLVEDLRHVALTCGVRTGKVSHRERTSQPPNSPEPIQAHSWAISLNFATVGHTEFDPKGNVGRGTAGRFAARQAVRMLDAQSRVARVEAIEPAGKRHVWDLTVEGTHSFIANGIAVHNTRKSHVDLYSRLIDDPTWTTVKDAASVWKVDVEPEEPIWPEMWDKAALLVRKTTLDRSDVLAWSQEYLNKPVPSSTQMFHPELWPQYVDEPHSLAMREDISVLQYWDLAISEKTTADFTVGVCAGVDDNNNMYLLEVRRGHWSFNDTLNQIGSLGASYPRVVGVGIEEVAYQAAAVQEAARRTMLPIIPVHVDKDKVTRARLVEARANIGKVYRPAARPNAEGIVSDPEWWADFATECSFFPDPGSHDDQPDALSGVAKMAGWSSESIGYAYGVFTCTSCGHMFVYAAGRPCPKCGTKAPEEFVNPDLASMGGLLEDDHSPEGQALQVAIELVKAMAKPVAEAPAAQTGYAEIALVLRGDDPEQIEGLRRQLEQMGELLSVRDGGYLVATKRYGFMRNALIQMPYVASVG
jgi:predicted phage terminase large subunit-like protein